LASVALGKADTFAFLWGDKDWYLLSAILEKPLLATGC
jgi:hypothetical protein